MIEDKIETAWKGKSWRLCVAQRTLKDGSHFQTAYIDHPGAVVIVPLQDKSSVPEVLMLRQYRYALRDTILELPAGTRGENEAWEICAQRELREETGYEAKDMVDLGECWPAPGVSNERMVIYLATGLQYNPLPQDSDEEIEVVSYPLDILLAVHGPRRPLTGCQECSRNPQNSILPTNDSLYRLIQENGVCQTKNAPAFTNLEKK